MDKMSDESTAPSKRSLMWHKIYDALSKLKIQHTDEDAPDKPSIATEIEQLFAESRKGMFTEGDMIEFAMCKESYMNQGHSMASALEQYKKESGKVKQ